MNGDREYYLATKIKKEFLIYTSEPFKFSEIDLINLIKICIIEGRSKFLGRKLLSIYRDSSEDRKKEVEEKLKMIGITENGEPERTKKPETK